MKVQPKSFLIYVRQLPTIMHDLETIMKEEANTLYFKSLAKQLKIKFKDSRSIEELTAIVKEAVEE